MKINTKQTFQIFWQNIRPYKSLFFSILFLISMAVILSLVIPIFYKQFFDILAEGITSNVDVKAKELIRILVIILSINGIVWLLYRLSGFIHANFSTKVTRDTLNSNFEYLHQHSHRFFINKFVGSLVRQVNRFVNSLKDITDRLFWDLVPLIVRVVGILIVLFIIGHRSIAGVMLVWIIFYLFLNYFYSIYKLKFDKERAAADSNTTAYLADSITNNSTIKSFAALPREFLSYKKLTQKQFKISRHTWYLGELSNTIQALLMIFLEFGVFYFAIQGWKRGLVTIGDFALIQAYLIELFNYLWGFGRVIRKLYENLADAEEMIEIINTPHEIVDKLQAKNLIVKYGEIKFDNVRFAYNKTRDVIKDFDLTIKPGEKIGLVGSSGAGKSTFVSLLFRNFDVSDGCIYIDQQNIEDVTQDSLRSQISLVPQDPILFHRSLKDNIRYGRDDATNKDVIVAAKLAHCHKFIESLPEKYNTLVGERGIKLSGGERQRIAIARAIIKNSPILVLDEATSSLDSHSELMIQDALENLMQNKTVIVVAHRLSTLLQMDRIIVMQNGVISEMGSHDELLQDSESLYKHLWELQAGGFISE